MPLVFDTPAPSIIVSPNRSDVACFIGFVARRPDVLLPSGVREALRITGWAKAPIAENGTSLPSSPWAVDEDSLQSLINIPVTVDSWEAFAKLFAWEKRPLREGDSDIANFCTTYLGAAVRSFFARGGKRAVIIRVGDPWPYLEPGAKRAGSRLARQRCLTPDLPDSGGRAIPFDALDPRSWRAIDHVYGLREVSLLCMPDLPDICAAQASAPDTAVPEILPPEYFVECSDNEIETPSDSGLRLIPAPRLDADSFASWRKSIECVRGFLSSHQREVVFIAAVPLPHVDARGMVKDDWVHAEIDMLSFLRTASVFEPDGQFQAGEFKSGEASGASAFVQFAYPWLRTRASTDLPESVEPADGVLTGLIAANALARGTFRSAAGQFSVPRLNDVHGCVPSIAWDTNPGSPIELLAERVCVFAPTPDGITLQSDVTGSPDPAWRFGGASRLMGALLRAARGMGESMVFEANGPVLWGRTKRAMEDLLTAFWYEGALAGASVEDAFTVRCGRSTMTQSDIDNGRLLVEISVRPAASIVWITVVLDLAANGSGADSLREVA